MLITDQVATAPCTDCVQVNGPISTILLRYAFENLNIERESSQLHFAAS
jgi:hypothetical protein